MSPKDSPINLCEVFCLPPILPLPAVLMLKDLSGEDFHPTKSVGLINHTWTIRGLRRHFADKPKSDEGLYYYYIIHKLMEAGLLIVYIKEKMRGCHFGSVMRTAYAQELMNGRTAAEKYKKYIILTQDQCGDDIYYGLHNEDECLEQMESNVNLADWYDFSKFETSEVNRIVI